MPNLRKADKRMRNFMRAFISIFFILLSGHCLSQDLFLYRDTVNTFSVGLPKGWKYQVINNANSSVKLTVFRSKDAETDNPRETYNVNVLSFPNLNIDLAYSNMLQSISTREGYKLLNEGDTTIDNKKYKWLIEQHTNINTKETMTAYIYLGYHSGLAYMVTFATIEQSFIKYEPLFRQISSTFRL